MTPFTKVLSSWPGQNTSTEFWHFAFCLGFVLSSGPVAATTMLHCKYGVNLVMRSGFLTLTSVSSDHIIHVPTCVQVSFYKIESSLGVFRASVLPSNPIVQTYEKDRRISGQYLPVYLTSFLLVLSCILVEFPVLAFVTVVAFFLYLMIFLFIVFRGIFKCLEFFCSLPLIYVFE